MSYLSYIRKVFKNLLDALHYAKIACRVCTRLDAEIQTSNASSGLKAASTATLASVVALCASIQAYLDSLPTS